MSNNVILTSDLHSDLNTEKAPCPDETVFKADESIWRRTSRLLLTSNKRPKTIASMVIITVLASAHMSSRHVGQDVLLAAPQTASSYAEVANDGLTVYGGTCSPLCTAGPTPIYATIVVTGMVACAGPFGVFLGPAAATGVSTLAYELKWLCRQVGCPTH